MVKATVAASILYFAIVFFLSFLLEKLHIITKPPLKKGFFLSALFYIGIVLTVLGIYVYESSKVIGGLCFLAGVIIGVLKTSSDSLHANAGQANPGAMEQEPAADAPDAGDAAYVPDTPDTPDNEADSITAGTPAAPFSEQIILNVVAGQRASFLYPYILLSLCFSLCVVFFIFAAIISFVASMFGKAQLAEIAAFFKLIASFDFGNSALRNATGPQTDALAVACVLAAGIILLILAVVFGLSIRFLKSKKIYQKVVPALLPGRQRGFVPSSEGIYKVCYRNLWTKNSFYCLYLWEALSLYALDEKKKRIVLKAGKMQMPLVPWDKKGGLFDSLKTIVFGHLPKERQSLPAQKDRYGWGRTAVAVLVILVLQAVLAGWLENASKKGLGNEYCDVGGEIHFTYRTAFGPPVYIMRIFGAENQTLYTYCALHGACYLVLHPSTYIGSVSRLIQENQLSQITSDLLLLSFLLILPPLIWLYLLVIALFAGKPLKSRFNML
ncbi:MAG TPA: hypothetical protein VN370_13505 [Desulfitobacteriaceae bacterium]|nr:hypothetical protein [Desulfitobacteriaceae bacterium]